MDKVYAELDGLVYSYQASGSVKAALEDILSELNQVKVIRPFSGNTVVQFNECDRLLRQMINKLFSILTFIDESYGILSTVENSIKDYIKNLALYNFGNLQSKEAIIQSIENKLKLFDLVNNGFEIASIFDKSLSSASTALGWVGAGIGIAKSLYVGGSRLVETWNSDKDLDRKIADTGAVVITSGLSIGFCVAGAAIGTAIFPGIGTAVGAIVGIGCGLIADLLLNDKVFNAVSNGIHAAIGAVKEVGKAIGNAAQAVVGAVKDVGQAVGTAAKEVGNAIGNAAKEVGKTISNAAKSIGKALTSW